MYVCSYDWPFGQLVWSYYFSCSQHSLVTRIMLYGLEDSFINFSHSTLACSLVSLFSSYLNSHVDEILWVYLLTILGDTILQQSGSYTLSVSSSAMFPEAWVWEYFIDLSFRTGIDNSAFWLFSVVVFIWCKERFPWWKMKITLIKLDPGGGHGESGYWVYSRFSVDFIFEIYHTLLNDWFNKWLLCKKWKFAIFALGRHF